MMLFTLNRTLYLKYNRNVFIIYTTPNCLFTATVKINKFQAAELLQSLYPDRNSRKLNKKQRRKIIEEATSIYNKIDSEKSVDVIHKLLKLYLHLGHSIKIKYLWNDIENLDKHKLEYSLLIKCCLDSNNIDKCLQSLRWMESSNNYILNIHDKLITKLISKCVDNVKEIRLIHRLIDKGFIINNNIFIKTALMNAYSKVNKIDIAYNIFKSIHDCDIDIICISTMMKILINHKQYTQALQIYDKIDTMNNPTLRKDNICHNLALQASSKLGDINKGNDINQQININNDGNIKTKTATISFYGNCGDIDNAWNIFKNIDDNDKDIVIICAMMKALIDNNYHKQALELYDKYQDCNKNEIGHLLALKACINLKNYDKGKWIHSQCQLNDNINIKNALISFYSICSDLNNAINIFHSIPDYNKDIVSYTVMMQAFLQNNNNQKVVELYNNINRDKIDIDTPCHLLAMQAYTNLNNVEKVNEIYLFLNHNTNDIESKIALIDFYGINGDIHNALNVYNSISDDERNNLCTNAILSVYIDNHYNTDALKLYHVINKKEKDNISHSLALKACSNIGNLEKGKSIHLYLKKNKPEFLDINLNTILIDFYGSCRDINNAMDLFNSIDDDQKDVVCIGAMMKCYINNDYNEKAIDLYNNWNGINKNNALHCLVIKAYTNTENFDAAQNIINSDVISMENNIIELLSAMIYLYGKSKNIDKAWDTYNSIDEYQKDIVMVNNMMYILQLNGYNEECLELFEQLSSDNYLDHLKPNIISFSNALIACTNGTLLEFGIDIHNKLNTEINKWMLSDVSTQTNLINMYGKCGRLDICKQIFFELRHDKHFKNNQNIAVWNAMIQTYGDNGDLQQAKLLYNNLKEEETNLNANKNTYSIMMNIYAYYGELDEAINVWENEINDDLIKFDNYIIASLVDVYSRKGLLDKADEIIQKYANKQCK